MSANSPGLQRQFRVFVSVGSQLPFERLIRAMDEWAQRNGACEVFAQVGDTRFRPGFMTSERLLTPSAYAERFKRADLIVSHVGMGTIISALEDEKPLVLLPRLAALGEHRSDHQLGSARQFKDRKLITVVETPEALEAALDNALAGWIEQPDQERPASNARSSGRASDQLINALQDFLTTIKAQQQ